jgi:hypothetical protein
VDINEGNQVISLSYNLTTYLNQTLDYLHILVTKTHNIYKLFLNGVLVDSKKQNKTKKGLLKLSKTLNRNFFGLIYDSIRTISPDLQPIIIQSSLKTIINFYFKKFKKKLKNFIPKVKTSSLL